MVRTYFQLDDLHSVWLVQRMIEQDNPNGKGIDKYFRMDYMGSSEFEWGALPDALRKWREDQKSMSDLMPRHIRFCKDRFTACYVGPAELSERIVKFLEMEINTPNEIALKECTRIRETYTPPQAPMSQQWQPPKIVGWWDIDNQWAVFTKAKYAHNFIDGLRNK